MPGRVETLQGPAGAGRAPFVVLLAVLLLVGTAIVVGWTLGWFVLLLVPALLLTLWVLWSVVSALRRQK